MKYQITVTFTYSNGTPGGLIQSEVRGKKAVEEQVAINLAWLSKKGHSPDEIKIEPVAKDPNDDRQTP